MYGPTQAKRGEKSRDLNSRKLHKRFLELRSCDLLGGRLALMTTSDIHHHKYTSPLRRELPSPPCLSRLCSSWHIPQQAGNMLRRRRGEGSTSQRKAASACTRPVFLASLIQTRLFTCAQGQGVARKAVSSTSPHSPLEAPKISPYPAHFTTPPSSTYLNSVAHN